MRDQECAPIGEKITVKVGDGVRRDAIGVQRRIQEVRR